MHYQECEEFSGDMWNEASGVAAVELEANAATLMRDQWSFLTAMCRAVDEWPNSCRVNMTAPTVNHLAWLGHAGCFLAVGSPEANTRRAWHTLSETEQNAANQAASEALAVWHIRDAERQREEQCQSGQLELTF
jgi:hypothetical protein